MGDYVVFYMYIIFIMFNVKSYREVCIFTVALFITKGSQESARSPYWSVTTCLCTVFDIM